MQQPSVDDHPSGGTNDPGISGEDGKMMWSIAQQRVSLILSLLLLGPGVDGMERSAIAQTQFPAPLIEDLVAANRILADQGVLDGFGHVSVRHPANPNRFLMSRSLAPALVQASDIMEYDVDGNAVDAQGRASFLERFIHSEIYKARPDVSAIIHSHAPALIPFGITQTPMRPVYHVAGFLHAGVPTFDIRRVAGMTNLLVGNNQLGKALAETLGSAPMVLMRGHGNVVVGPEVSLAVYRAIYAQVNAQLQAQAIALGGPVTYLDPEEARKAEQVNNQVHKRAWDLWKQAAMSKP